MQLSEEEAARREADLVEQVMLSGFEVAGESGLMQLDVNRRQAMAIRESCLEAWGSLAVKTCPFGWDALLSLPGARLLSSA